MNKKYAETVTSIFRLHQELYPLFLAAVIDNLKQHPKLLGEQINRDAHAVERMNRLANGMLTTTIDQSAHRISQIACQVLYHSTSPNPRLFLDCSKREWNSIKQEPLDLPFAVLGKFLVQYGLRNCLKGEVLSIYSRLEFINLVRDFVECYDDVKEDKKAVMAGQVSNTADQFIDEMESEYERALDELDDLNQSMTADDIDVMDNFRTFMEALEKVCAFVKSFTHEQQDHFVNLCEEALNTAQYIFDNGVGKTKDFKDEIKILASLKEPCLKILEGRTSHLTHFRTDPNRVMRKKEGVGWTKWQLNQLDCWLGDPDDDSDDDDVDE